MFNISPFDIICANPPYIPSSEMIDLAPNVKDWEPTLALHGGQDGLDIIKPLLEESSNLLSEKGCILIEISPTIQLHAFDFANSLKTLKNITILKDQYGDERFLKAYKS